MKKVMIYSLIALVAVFLYFVVSPEDTTILWLILTIGLAYLGGRIDETQSELSSLKSDLLVAQLEIDRLRKFVVGKLSTPTDR